MRNSLSIFIFTLFSLGITGCFALKSPESEKDLKPVDRERIVVTKYRPCYSIHCDTLNVSFDTFRVVNDTVFDHIFSRKGFSKFVITDTAWFVQKDSKLSCFFHYKSGAYVDATDTAEFEDSTLLPFGFGPIPRSICRPEWWVYSLPFNGSLLYEFMYSHNGSVSADLSRVLFNPKLGVIAYGGSYGGDWFVKEPYKWSDIEKVWKSKKVKMTKTYKTPSVERIIRDK